MADKAYITPQVLKWARESARMSIETAAAKVLVDPVQLKEWEDGTSQPTIHQGETLAKVYRRPFALFFLPDVPIYIKPLHIKQKRYQIFKNLTIKPIGFVKNNRTELIDDDWSLVESIIELVDDLPEDCFDGIEQFSHLEVIYYFNKSTKTFIGSEHPRENKDFPKVGIFAQRKKDRPNHLGATIVNLVRRDGRILVVKNLDAIDGTPVIDIKPIFREFLPQGDVIQPDWASELMKRYW